MLRLLLTRQVYAKHSTLKMFYIVCILIVFGYQFRFERIWMPLKKRRKKICEKTLFKKNQFELYFLVPTVCPTSLGPFYVLSYWIKWAKTSLKYSMFSIVNILYQLYLSKLKVSFFLNSPRLQSLRNFRINHTFCPRSLDTLYIVTLGQDFLDVQSLLLPLLTSVPQLMHKLFYYLI